MRTAKRPIRDRIMVKLAVAHTQRVLRQFLAAANNAVDTQNRVLLSKIRRNATSDFGRDFGFKEISSYADFVRNVPILDYEKLEPYIDKVKAGRVNAMFGPGQTVHMFAMTSGTTDRPKYVPVTGDFLKDYRRGWNAFGIKVLLDHPGCFLRHIVQTVSPMDEDHTEAGYPCGAITGMMAATQKRLVRRYYVAPREAAYITDATARYYTLMRFAIPQDVAWMVTASPATQLRLARTADERKEDLIRDIRDGALSARIDVPSSVLLQLTRRLAPDPQTANRLEKIVSRTGRLLPKDYWNLGFLANWTGGTMGMYLQDFPEYFGEAPVRDIGLLASEGRMSIPVQDWTASGILDVVCNFFEFVPADEYGDDSGNRRKDPPVLRAHEVEVGKEYFILMTNSAGFYRYDIGDRVRVTGFHGQAPIIEFLHKGLHASSLTGEKLTERQVVMAFERAAAQSGHGITNFVVAPRWGNPPHYRLYGEEAAGLSSDLWSTLVDAFESELRAINIEYACKRDSGRLGKIELRILPGSALTDLDRQKATQRRANEQFKHRYLLSEVGQDQHLDGAVNSQASSNITT